MGVAWEHSGCERQQSLLAHSPEVEGDCATRKVSTRSRPPGEKGLTIILMQGCHCEVFAQRQERPPSQQMQHPPPPPTPGLTAWQDHLGLHFNPDLSPCLGTASTTVYGSHNLMYPLNNDSISTAKGGCRQASLAGLFLALCHSSFPIPFVCAPVSSLRLLPSSWTSSVSTLSRSSLLDFKFFLPLGSFI